MSSGYYFYATPLQKKEAYFKLIEVIRQIGSPESDQFERYMELTYLYDVYYDWKTYFVNLVLKSYFGPTLFRRKAQKKLLEKLNFVRNHDSFKLFLQHGP